MRLESLLRAVLHVVPFFSTVEAFCLGGVPIPWCRYISSGRWSFSSLSPVAIPLSPPVVGGAAPAEVHGYWDIVHGWGCICGVVVLRASLLVVVLPVILKKGSPRLAVKALEWGSSCEAFLQDAFNYCLSHSK